MKRVSFDFDSTLDRFDVQQFAKRLKGFDIHIVTSRYRDSPEYDNSDVFLIATQLRIPFKNIHFTNHTLKAIFFKKNPDFLFHLDDNPIELEFIQRETKVPAVSVLGNWKKNCLKLIKS